LGLVEGQGPQTPPGWYQNPDGPGQRYWSGAQWTDDFWQPQPESKLTSALKEWWWVPVAAVVVIAIAVGALQSVFSNSLSYSEADSVELGDTRAAVKEKLGSPASTGDGIGGRECMFYNRKGASRSQWQFCFGGTGDDARLEVRR
jgi:hypothetical protein